MSELAYFDSSIWIASLNTKDKHNDFADALIKKMENDEFQTIMTKLAMMETIGAIRTKVPVFEKYTGELSPEKIMYLEQKIASKIQLFIESATYWEKNGKVLLTDGALKYADFARESFTQHIMDKATLVDTDWCPSCRRPLKINKYKYYGLGHWDFQHAILAKKLGVSVLYTTDEDFRKLNQNLSFRPLNFITKKMFFN